MLLCSRKFFFYVFSFENVTIAGYLNDSTGNMSDYINTSLHTHYDTDFPELTTKFEKFSLGAGNNNNPAAALNFWGLSCREREREGGKNFVTPRSDLYFSTLRSCGGRLGKRDLIWGGSNYVSKHNLRVVSKLKFDIIHYSCHIDTSD